MNSLLAMKAKPTKETLSMKFTLFIEESYELVRKSLAALYSLVERSKAKSKDSHVYIRSSTILRHYSEQFFKNERTVTMIQKLADHTSDEFFKKNIDVQLKFELDLRMGYLMNSAYYKNNLRCEYFKSLSISELENIKTLKKAEKLAFKENNPLYLALSFRSMEYNIRDLFRKVYKALNKEIEMILAADFGNNLDSIKKLVNDNEEYNLFTNDKKQFDGKNPRSLIAFARDQNKTDVFNLLASYIFETYNSICHLYYFGRNQKSLLSKKFCEAGLAVDPNQTQKVNGLLEEVHTKETVV